MEINMKKWQFGCLLGLVLLVTGFSRPIFPLEGVYDLKLKTLTFFDLLSKDVPLQSITAELTESRPDNLEVQVNLAKLTEPTFGSLRLGNNDRKVWFVMGKGEQGYWTEVYLDQNGDRRITTNEKLKSLQTLDIKERKIKRNSAYTMVPVAIKVSFKGVKRQYVKKLYYFIYVDIIHNKTGNFTVAGVTNASFLDGELKVAVGKELKLIKVRLFDINANGCFNDYGSDMIYLDTNYDGLFKKNEGHILTEFFDYGANRKQVKQYRLLLPPQPAKMAVIDSFREFDRSLLEAKQGTDDEPSNEPKAVK
jgi:hypothetical protein